MVVERLAGKTLGHYHLERLLASNSQSGIYQDRDERLERPVAIKVSALPAAPEQFRAEARLTGSLDHPNILPIYDFGTQEGIAYLVRHYAAGGSLEDQLRAVKGKSGLPLDEVAYYPDQVAAALDYAHTRGIVHGKLKPANLLLRERWLMLGDFAAAQRSGAGTRGEASGQAADMHALGVTVYRLLWGKHPRADAKDHAPAGAAASRQAQAVETLLRKAMSPKPEDCPQTAGALAAEFHAIIAASGATGSSGQ